MISDAPFQPGDRVRVNAAGLRTTSAPRTSRLLYVINCRQSAVGSWRVSLVGKPGFRPYRGEPTGYYNAGFFDLVRREPVQQTKR